MAWSANQPDVYYTSLREGMRYCSLEEISLEILSTLNQYYSTYKRLFDQPCNLHFKIEYLDNESNPKRITSFSNDEELTLDTARNYGRYACLQGNSVFYDTNFKSIDLDTVSALSANNPYSTKTYYLLAALDTNYPADDAYAANYRHYVRMQNYYFLGFALMAVGGLTAAFSLLYLLSVSGRQEDGDHAVSLTPFDHTSTETGMMIVCLMTAAALFACRYTMVRVLHLTLSEESWDVGEKGALHSRYLPGMPDSRLQPDQTVQSRRYLGKQLDPEAGRAPVHLLYRTDLCRTADRILHRLPDLQYDSSPDCSLLIFKVAYSFYDA